MEIPLLRYYSLVLLLFITSASAGDHNVLLDDAPFNNLYSILYYGDSDVNVGQSFTITCFVSVSEPVQWFRDGEPLIHTRHGKEAYSYFESKSTVQGDENKVEATIKVQRAHPKHAGKYKCNNKHRNFHTLHVRRTQDRNEFLEDYDELIPPLTAIDDEQSITPVDDNENELAKTTKHHHHHHHQKHMRDGADSPIIHVFINESLTSMASIFTTFRNSYEDIGDITFPEDVTENVSHERNRIEQEMKRKAFHENYEEAVESGDDDTSRSHELITPQQSNPVTVTVLVDEYIEVVQESDNTLVTPTVAFMANYELPEKANVDADNQLTPSTVAVTTSQSSNVTTASTLPAIKLKLKSTATEEAGNNLVPHFEFPNAKTTSFHIRKALVLSCNITLEGKFELGWEKDGTNVTKIDNLSGRYTINKAERTFIIEKTVETDAGTYTCSIPGMNESKDIIVIANVYVKLPTNVYVVEEEKLTIQCMVVGTDPVLHWTIGNETFFDSGDRVRLEEDENKVMNAKLVIDKANLDDRDEYTCYGKNEVTHRSVSSVTFVRVKGKLAALWPFLGICAEVFVLCAIILIYEKRRNKTELDDSDTDQNGEQKNDHLAKEADVRHRK